MTLVRLELSKIADLVLEFKVVGELHVLGTHMPLY